MKKLIAVLTLALMLGAGSLFAGSFEGVVGYQMTVNNDKKMDMEYMMKGKKFRSNMSHDGMEMSTIMDMGSKKMITLMHKQKMYMTHTMDKTMATASKHPVDGKFYKASGSKTILGYTCEHWVYEGKAGKTDMWLASGLGTFMGLSNGGGQGGSMGGEDWVKAIKGKSFFPLEIDSTGKDGKGMTMEATKVEAKSLSDSLFEVPSGYKKMPDYSGMTKGAKNPSGGDMLKGMKPKLPF